MNEPKRYDWTQVAAWPRTDSEWINTDDPAYQEMQEHALRYQLDQLGIEQREAERAELVELRAIVKRGSGRYVEVTDDSFHHYIIPVSRLDDWNAFVELDEDDPASWDVPSWAERIDGGRLTFENPRIDEESE